MVFGGPNAPLPLMDGTDLAGAEERVAHVAACLPEICTLDCGTMNFAESDYVMTNTPGMLETMGARMEELGVKPEIEAFDLSHIFQAVKMVEDGRLKGPLYVQFVMGVKNAMPVDKQVFDFYVKTVKRLWIWILRSTLAPFQHGCIHLWVIPAAFVENKQLSPLHECCWC